MIKTSDHFVWRLPSGGFWCSSKNAHHFTKIPSTPYINNAKIFPSIESAKFMKPNVNFPLTLYRMSIICEEVNETKT